MFFIRRTFSLAIMPWAEKPERWVEHGIIYFLRGVLLIDGGVIWS
jgi:hypothetical protein